MSMTSQLLTALLLGLLSSTHCVVMCGPIIGALSLAVETTSSRRRSLCLLFYNLGRVLTYMLLAALFGGLVQLGIGKSAAGHNVLRVVAAAILVLIGLQLLGWRTPLLLLERGGMGLWRKIQPYSRKLLPVGSVWQALAFGVLWGWLPCGLVYSTLVWSSTSAQLGSAALLMGAFGLGTLPALIATGHSAQVIRNRLENPILRRSAGLLLIVAALASVIVPAYHSEHDYDYREHPAPSDH
jgi:sulfite exporter TauE/SafE